MAGEYLFRFPGWLHRTLTFSYDDGQGYDRRLCGIFEKNGLKATFNLNAGQMPEKPQTPGRLTAEEARALYPAAGMEVALHGYQHIHTGAVPNPMVCAEILNDRKRMEEIFGQMICGFAYPYGSYSDDTVEILRLCGVKYARTTVSTHQFEMPTDWLRLPATCHHNDPQLTELGDRFLAMTEDPNTLWRTRMQMFYVWGHSYEFENNHNWERIEQFAAKMGGHADIWYATNMEICRYTEAIRRLEASPSGEYCYNPTDTDVYFICDGKKQVVRAGQTLSL